MIWDYFIYFAIVAIMLWAVGAFLAWKEKKAGVYASRLTGMAVFFIEVGQDVHITGGFEDAVNDAVREAYTNGFLRKSSALIGQQDTLAIFCIRNHFKRDIAFLHKPRHSGIDRLLRVQHQFYQVLLRKRLLGILQIIQHAHRVVGKSEGCRISNRPRSNAFYRTIRSEHSKV